MTPARALGLTDNMGITGFGVLVCVLIVGALLFAVTVPIVASIEGHECHVAETQIRRHTHYAGPFSGGCYVDNGAGQKVPLESYNSFVKGR